MKDKPHLSDYIPDILAIGFVSLVLIVVILNIADLFGFSSSAVKEKQYREKKMVEEMINEYIEQEYDGLSYDSIYDIGYEAGREKGYQEGYYDGYFDSLAEYGIEP